MDMYTRIDENPSEKATKLIRRVIRMNVNLSVRSHDRGIEPKTQEILSQIDDLSPQQTVGHAAGGVQDHLSVLKAQFDEVVRDLEALLRHDSVVHNAMELEAVVKAGIHAKQTEISPTLKFQTTFNLHELLNKIREKNRLEGYKMSVTSVSFSPDSRLLASGSGDGSIKLWNVADGQELTTLHAHVINVLSVSFSPDGTLLVSGNGNGTIKLWNVTDGHEITTLHGHTGAVRSVAFSSNGTLLASGSEDSTIKLWPLGLDYYLLRGCEWLHGYLKTNPNVSETDRGLCDDILDKE
jgi:WD40 repeat protein